MSEFKVFEHTFKTFLHNGVYFKEYKVIGNRDRKIARARLNLFIDENSLKIINKIYTEFLSYTCIDL